MRLKLVSGLWILEVEQREISAIVSTRERGRASYEMVPTTLESRIGEVDPHLRWLHEVKLRPLAPRTRGLGLRLNEVREDASTCAEIKDYRDLHQAVLERDDGSH